LSVLVKPSSLNRFQSILSGLSKLPAVVKFGEHLINPLDIIHCKSLGSCSEIITSKKGVVFGRHLKDVERRLNHWAFTRASRSSLVNPYHIADRIQRNRRLQLEMSNGDIVNVSRSFQSLFVAGMSTH
jgi:DNA-binding LytR/AlgR family response regulator